jgi:hypothetical protein
MKLFPATRVFEIVCFDLLGPFPRTDRGNILIAVFVCKFSNWIELVAIPDATALTTATVLVNEIICRHGCPRAFHTDRGSNFIASLFRRVCKILGINKIFTTSYAAIVNGAPKA